jgi:tetratricopeptide (TPR) repeat protein
MNKNDELIYAEGINCYKKKDYLNAINYFSIIINNDQENDKAWNALGATYIKVNQYNEANIAFEKAINLKPNNEAYQKNFKIINKKLKIVNSDNIKERKINILDYLFNKFKELKNNTPNEPKTLKNKFPEYKYYCRKCGNEIQLSQEFCLSCGSKIIEELIEIKSIGISTV